MLDAYAERDFGCSRRKLWGRVRFQGDGSGEQDPQWEPVDAGGAEMGIPDEFQLRRVWPNFDLELNAVQSLWILVGVAPPPEEESRLWPPHHESAYDRFVGG
ncbi:MAG: hypothetical protein HY320_06135 [Armatimonadetes bacterium]|nr:hypothetical protein [Armatimonadota bacterium]